MCLFEILEHQSGGGVAVIKGSSLRFVKRRLSCSFVFGSVVGLLDGKVMVSAREGYSIMYAEHALHSVAWDVMVSWM